MTWNDFATQALQILGMTALSALTIASTFGLYWFRCYVHRRIGQADMETLHSAIKTAVGAALEKAPGMALKDLVGFAWDYVAKSSKDSLAKLAPSDEVFTKLVARYKNELQEKGKPDVVTLP